MSGKLPNGQGSIRKRTDGLWEGRITLQDGRRVSFYDQKRDVVVRQLRAAGADRDKGLPVGPEKMTVEQFLTKWLEVKEATLRSPRTWERYAELIRLHIIPVLGSVHLAKLTARQVQDLYASKRAEGLSSTTVHHIHAVLHAALEYAVRQEYVYRNVSEAVDAPKLRRREMTAWTAQQARQFLRGAQADRLYGLFVLALATGMRQGELFGLRWQDVDLETGVINVVHAVRRSRQAGTELAKPKTDSSQRTIAIDANTIAVVRSHRVKQDVERLLAGDAWNDNDLVFADSTGGPLRGSNVERRHFGPLMAHTGVPRIRFHDLRHTAASILVASGVPIKVVSEMLGHASISLTLATYVHVSPTMQRDAANVLGSVLFSQV